MTEHWISAAKALDVCGNSFAICKRANAGLVSARARLFLIDGTPTEWMEVPKEFWWASGEAALTQDWQSGDFSTWIDQKRHLKAFGVDFGLSGILKMLEFTERPLIARSLSVAGNPEWMTTSEALRVVASASVCRQGKAKEFIVEQGRLGFIAGRAVKFEIENPTGGADKRWEAREWDLPEWYWREFIEHGFDDWDIGRFDGKGRDLYSDSHIIISGLHFHRRSISAIIGTGETSESATTNSNPAGRKRKYDWDGALDTVWGQILHGELIPDNQAKIEQAIQACLRRGDEEPSESSVRPYANRVWRQFSREAEN